MTAKRLSIRLDDLADAMDSSGDHAWALDLDSGDTSPQPSDLFFDEETDDCEAGEGAGEERTAMVPSLGSPEGHALRVRFTETVRDEELRFRLHDALRGRGAFGRFRALLDDDLDERDRFFAFRAEQLEPQARTWLDSLGIDYQLVTTPRAGSALQPPPPVSRATELDLIDVLLFGAPDGKTELIEGYVRRFVPAQDRGTARSLFKRLARQACEIQGMPWRKHLIEGRDELEVGRFRLAVHDRGLDVAVRATIEQYLRFRE